MAELEKLGPKFRIALRLAKDPRFRRLTCTHSGTYADDCLCLRAQEVRASGGCRGGAQRRGPGPVAYHPPTPPQHRCYIVATCDRDLKRRLRKVRAGAGEALPVPALGASRCGVAHHHQSLWVVDPGRSHYVHQGAQVHY